MTTPPTKTSAYQCAVCSERYSRPDHLIRHVRTHTKQRPFACAVCTKAFARRDLLKRHAQAHCNAGYTGAYQNPDAPGGEAGRSGPRVQQACRACATKKLKCTDTKPCRRCTQKNIPCEYGEDSDSRPVNSQVENVADPSFPIASPTATGERGTSKTSSRLKPGLEQLPQGIDSPMDKNVHNVQLGEQHVTPDTNNLEVSPMDFSMTSAPVEEQDSLDADAPHDVLGFTFDLPSFGDFIQQEADTDFGYLDLSLPSGFITTPAAQSVQQNSDSSATLHSPVMGFVEEIYQNSHVHKGWNPEPTDRNSETEDLELPSNVRSEVQSTLYSRKLMLRKDDLTVGTRDKILAMIYARTPRSVWARMSATFESIDILKSMLHLALLHMQDHRMIPFIHLASFDLNEQRPELLGALIAYGAICLPSAAMRKFGYGLQEIVRLAINQKIEDEPASMRDLGFMQAYYVQLYLGFWSGISAKIEVAESSSMLGATILRRRNMFRSGSFQPPEAFLSLDGLSLQERWSKWVEQESKARLVYFAMLVDAEVSLARNINPLFAYSEMETPLPTSTRLWEAPTAERWYEVLSQDNSLRLRMALPLKRVLCKPELMQSEKDIIELSAAAAALLAGYWAMVYEYRQMNLLHCASQDWNTFVLSSRREELVSLMDQLKMELFDMEELRTQVVVFQELIQLHLNAAYYELSACFGRGTMEEAITAKPYVEWWSGSQQGRQAIFHAGQIIRFLTHLRPGGLLDMPVVALYHATETMWVWGLMQRAQHLEQDPSSNASPVPVFLDGDESPATAKFIKMSRGQPGLTSASKGLLPLVEPALVSDCAHDIIKANWGSYLQPWTTSEVSRLVQGFSRISHERLGEC